MKTASVVALMILGFGLILCCTLPSVAMRSFWASGRSLVIFGGSEGHVTRQARALEESERPSRITFWTTAAVLTFVGGVSLIGAGCVLVWQGRVARKKANIANVGAALEVRDLKARISEFESRSPRVEDS